MNKKILVATSMLIAGAYSFGQAPGGVDPMLSDSAGLGEAVDGNKTAMEQAEAFLADKNNKNNGEGWNPGFNKNNGYFIAIGTAPIQVPTSHPKFYLARRTAFAKAMLAAKQELALNLSAEVSRAIEQRYEMPDYNNALDGLQESVPEAPGMLEKAQMLIHAELDSLLDEKGIDPNADSEAAQAVVKELIGTSGFEDAVTATANAEVAGMFAYKIYEVAPPENTGEVAVIAIMSPATRQLSGAILGLNPSPIKKAKNSISQYVNSIDSETLISTHGVKTRTDQNGDLNVIAFGQSKARTKSSTQISMARKSARLAAMGALRSFAGEKVVSQEGGGASTTLEEYVDGTQAFIGEESLNTLVKARAASLSMPGISTVRSWTGLDSRSGEQIQGVIVAWNLGSALNANVLRDQLNSRAGSAGGRGVSDARPVKPSGSGSNNGVSTNQKPAAPSPYSSSGLQSDDDDF
jgi:hypothetical protein